LGFRPAALPPDDASNEPALIGMDEQLLEARAGEPKALAALVRAHQRSVYSLALRMLGARDLAEDLTQEVFMEMTDNLTSMQSNEHLTFWLRRVTTHRAIDQLRRRARIEITSLDELLLSDGQPAAGLASGAHASSAAEEADPVWQRHLQLLLAQLTPDARAVMLLRYQEDLDPLEIARTLGMSINTVKSHLKRSLEFMRQTLNVAADRRREDHST
jgi:RNA polymerase sigma-70 factor (ECF subfamily)